MNLNDWLFDIPHRNSAPRTQNAQISRFLFKPFWRLEFLSKFRIRPSKTRAAGLLYICLLASSRWRFTTADSEGRKFFKIRNSPVIPHHSLLHRGRLECSQPISFKFISLMASDILSGEAQCPLEILQLSTSKSSFNR